MTKTIDEWKREVLKKLNSNGLPLGYAEIRDSYQQWRNSIDNELNKKSEGQDHGLRP